MAPGLAVTSRRLQSLEKVRVVAPPEGEEDVRMRNRELEEELRRSREREEAAQKKLELTRERLRVAEEAEERLCAQLGELEAEAVGEARAYLLQIQYLTDQLSRAQQLHHHDHQAPAAAAAHLCSRS